MGAGLSRRAIPWAIFGAILFAGWQQLTVTRNFGGNWTALFCTGSGVEVPPDLEKGTYRVPDTYGFDGQMYRYVAHDPFLTGTAHRYTDNAALRARRILVPGMAWLIALGRPAWIDPAYIGVLWAFCFCGIYWTAKALTEQSVPPRFALLFLLLPATLITADRLVIDMPFCALTAGVVWAVLSANRRRVVVFLGLAALCRETGLVLIAGFALASVFERRWREAVRTLCAALPALAWYGFIWFRISSEHYPVAARLPDNIGAVARLGPMIYLLHPTDYPLPWPILPITQNLDRLAIVSVFASLGLAGVLWLRRPKEPIPFVALLFGLTSFGATLSPVTWDSSYNYLRLFSPLFLVLALAGAPGSKRWPLWLAPSVLADPRVALQLGPQLLGIFGAFQ